MIKEMPKNTEVEVNHSICEHHKKNPHDIDYPGCTCSSSYVLIQKELYPR